jgi:hypothetical protein
VFTDNIPVAGSNTLVYKYVIADSVTGQNIVAPTVITSTGTVTGAPKVFLLGTYFVLVFDTVITAVNHLQYIAISTAAPTTVTAATDISVSYVPATTGAFDGMVANNSLYLAWAGLGTTIKMCYLTSTLVQSNVISFAAKTATIMSVVADTSGNSPTVYATFYDSGSTNAYTAIVDASLNTILAPAVIFTGAPVKNNITGTATGGVLTVFYESTAAYSYDSGIPTHLISSRTVALDGTTSAATVVARGVGLASKATLQGTISYFLTIYSSQSQPTYFLLNGTGAIVGKLAYSNGPWDSTAKGYYVTGLPSLVSTGSTMTCPYLIKDLITSVNKIQGAAFSSPIYAQTGINYASFTIATAPTVTSEIGNDLHLSGGFLSMYDGYAPVEHGFHLYPDYVELTGSGAGGTMTAQQYFYQVTYEWTDNQGNVFRSAPSIPVSVTTTGATSSVVVNVPTLRMTAKTANPVNIVIYRWSAAQQTYYRVTSLLIPTQNSTTVDSIAFTDTLPDSGILGNTILYTTGGTVENIGAPATDTMTLFKSRLFLVDSEDKNLLWYSKQVIETTPVEMSDLFTIYVAPTTSAHGDTGPMRCLTAMDDKLVIFKENAIYYLVGNGPDNTGANNDFSEPVFVTSTVGCDNQNSIVFMPQGLMFQSDKGIWLLDRNLSTSYIGAAVEDFTASATVLSAVNIPGTNQVRFTLDSGITLMYDYYYGQWGTFTNVNAISSTLFQNLHTTINSRGQVRQETPGVYLDGSVPVLMSFKTSWLNLMGVQGYERAYQFTLLGTYITPHKLSIGIAYDYQAGPTQVSVIEPDNYTGAYGSDSLYGGSSTYGGNSTVEQWRTFFARQKCEAFQITISESYDPSFGVPAGAGLTLSGLNLVIGAKKGYRPTKAANSVG